MQEQWTLRGEGNAHIVIACMSVGHAFMGKVLRIKKGGLENLVGVKEAADCTSCRPQSLLSNARHCLRGFIATETLAILPLAYLRTILANTHSERTPTRQATGMKTHDPSSIFRLASNH